MRRSYLAAALAVALSVTPANAGVLCFLEASAGKNVTSTRIGDDIAGPITVAADGLTAGIGAGCDYAVSDKALAPVIGALIRYDFSDVSARVFAERAEIDAVWSAAAKLGLRVNPSVTAYGLAGVAGTEITLGDLSRDRLGLLIGAGLDVDLAVRNLSLFLEWNQIQWDRWSEDGATVRPNSDVIRLGLRIKLGAAPGGAEK